ncbi:unnamed protein product [Prorocentrum cordatum]|uniref:Ribulose-bisphosphate carboxylase n=1 Tax=Prorocentrum cordatum TaxID=2364126 RepID=A0ABN9RTU8_9DINO|nr:unnamed protein product [Polarella glacialis]
MHPRSREGHARGQEETGQGKLFSANITADDPNEMIARAKYILNQMGPMAENCAFLVDGYVAGGTAVTVARRNFPKQFLHYHRAGHGAVTSPQTQRGYTAFVHTKLSRVIGASGIHTGTMSFGKMEGDASDKNIGFMLQDDVADGPYYRQEWEGMKQTTPIISGGMNALRLPAFFENLGHSNVILTAGGGAFGHKDGPKQGAISCAQGEESWKLWKAGTYGDVSLSDGVVEYAKTHEELKGAFLTFQKDADQIYPGWKEKLGYTGESSVQAASFNWQKKELAAAFVGASKARKASSVTRQALDQSSRYADLSLTEEDLIKNGQHVLVAYIMKPKAGYDYLATAAHFAAESSTGTNVNVCTTDDFTKTVDALVYYIDPENEEMKIAYPTALFDRNITDGRAMMCSVLTLSIGNNQGMGDVDYGKIYMNECIPEVVKAMRAAQEETGQGKLFSANITADDPNEMIARAKYILNQMGPMAENCAFLVDGYVAGGTAVTVARRNFPKQFLHYHRAGHGAVTSPQTQRGYTAFVHTKLSRVIGASGIHTGTMSFGKMEGDASDKNIGFMLQDDVADGPYYRQEWEGMKQTTPIISGGMNALRLPAFFENLGHSNVILTAGGGAFGHKDGPKQGAISCAQGEESWKLWKAGTYGDVSLSDGVVEYAKTHEELKGAFLTFQKDADQIYPGWKEKLGYTGESSVQAASFNWQKKELS